MPSEQAARYIEQSLAKGESPQDFAYMMDSLTDYRRLFHPEQSLKIVEQITGLVLCLLVIVKPPRYTSAMGSFRLLFRGIAEDQEKQLQFYNSILPTVLLLQNENQVIFRPSLYFSPLTVLGIEASVYMTSQDRVGWFRTNLPNWF